MGIDECQVVSGGVGSQNGIEDDSVRVLSMTMDGQGSF